MFFIETDGAKWEISKLSHCLQEKLSIRKTYPKKYWHNSRKILGNTFTRASKNRRRPVDVNTSMEKWLSQNIAPQNLSTRVVLNKITRVLLYRYLGSSEEMQIAEILETTEQTKNFRRKKYLVKTFEHLKQKPLNDQELDCNLFYSKERRLTKRQEVVFGPDVLTN